MEFQFHLSKKSSNGKTGDIPVSTTSEASCPLSCPLKNAGCFGENFPMKYHWDAVSRGERGFATFEDFLDAISKLPDLQVWRHNQVGDLPHKGDKKNLDGEKVAAIARANTGKKGFTYTHFDPSEGNNAEIIQDANARGFVINLSADNLKEADQFKALGIAPVTVVLPIHQITNLKTPAGNTVVVCPKESAAGKGKGIKCKNCKLCAWSSREVIIGFPAHGTRKKQAELISLG